MSKFKLVVFDTKEYDLENFKVHTKDFIEITYFKEKLTKDTVSKCKGYDGVCVFVNDVVCEEVLSSLKDFNVNLVLTRSVGFNQIDVQKAKEIGIEVCNVPSYSPNSIAEFALTLLLAASRKVHRTHQKVHNNDFTLNGLEGYNIHDKKIGIIGSGKIGKIFAQIVKAMGADVSIYDIMPDEDWASKYGIKYVSLEEIYKESQIISLHTPLTEETKYLINKDSLSLMQDNVVIVNTARGGLINTIDLIETLKNGKVLFAALDVYENEKEYFFEQVDEVRDEVLRELLSLDNVILTPHQAFYTKEALDSIYETTIFNVCQYINNEKLKNTVY